MSGQAENVIRHVNSLLVQWESGKVMVDAVPDKVKFTAYVFTGSWQVEIGTVCDLLSKVSVDHCGHKLT